MVCNDLTIELIFSIPTLAPFSGVLGVLLYPARSTQNKWPCFDVVCFSWCFLVVQVVFVPEIQGGRAPSEVYSCFSWCSSFVGAL